MCLTWGSTGHRLGFIKIAIQHGCVVFRNTS